MVVLKRITYAHLLINYYNYYCSSYKGNLSQFLLTTTYLAGPGSRAV